MWRGASSRKDSVFSRKMLENDDKCGMLGSLSNDVVFEKNTANG